MKQNYIYGLALVYITLAMTCSVKAQDNFLLKSAKAYIEGTSSLHDWKSEITTIECKGQFKRDTDVLIAVESAEVKIPVAGIKSTKGKMMDNKTYEAFKYKKNPYIIYTATNGHIKTGASGTIVMEVSGNLAMAGVTKPFVVTAKGKMLSNGDLQLTVSTKLKMTDFKMEPPTALMGTITVSEEVTVNLDLVLTPAGEPAKKT